MITSVYPYGDPISVPSYLPILNPYRAPSEQQVEALQEERRKTIEQVKSLENMISSGEIKVDEATQLQYLYIIKLKRCISMLETNVKDFSEEKKSHVDLKT